MAKMGEFWAKSKAIAYRLGILVNFDQKSIRPDFDCRVKSG